MAWRFKASKYKNSAPKVPKKEEWISGLNAGKILLSQGNHIKASNVHMVFNVDSAGGGGLIGILPLNYSGRIDLNVYPFLHAHSDYVTDFEFSPFDDCLLATASGDCTVKLWNVPEDSSTGGLEASLTLQVGIRRVENILWHPAAESVLCAANGEIIKVYDINAASAKYVLQNHEDQVQSMTWRPDGSFLATTCKDKMLRICDPRAQTTVQETQCHESNKDTRAVWLSNQDMIMTAGSNAVRQRELKVWDIRNFSNEVGSVNLDTSTGAMMPLYDGDTNMLLLMGKGDANIKFLEITYSTPFITQVCTDPINQIKGACLVPKMSLDVMKCEVNRMLVLSKQHIIPVPYCVPRKSYADYHSDLFPDAFSGNPSLTGEEWFSGQNRNVNRSTLDPSKRPKLKFHRSEDVIASSPSMPVATVTEKPQDVCDARQNASLPNLNLSQAAESQKTVHNGAEHFGVQLHSEEHKHVDHFAAYKQREQPPAQPRSSHSRFSQFKTSKFKNAAPQMPKKEYFISGLNAGKILLSHGNHIKASNAHMVFNVDSAGGGGLIGILPLTYTGRIDRDAYPFLHAHADYVTDFEFSPFDDCLLATGSGDCTVKLWNIPENGITEEFNPSLTLNVGTKRVENVLWHPTADGVLCASYADTVKVYDVNATSEKYVLQGNEDHVLSMTWRPDGSFLATTCQDKMLRIHDPRAQRTIQETPCHESNKDIRAVWLANQDMILTAGFTATRQRQLKMWDVRNFSEAVGSISLDTSTGAMMPLYDGDTNMLLLMGKGDANIKYLEITYSPPFITQVCTDPINQIKGACLVPKMSLDTMKCEVNRMLVLSKQHIIPVPYCVPRKNYSDFHADLFPEAFSGYPSLTADQWFAGQNKNVNRVSLDPSTRPELNLHRSQIMNAPGSSVALQIQSGELKAPSPARFEAGDSADSAVQSVGASPILISAESKRIESSPLSEVKYTTDSVAPAISSTANVKMAEDEVTVVRREKHGAARPFTGVRQSKFRHLKGTPLSKSEHIDNLRNLSTTIPGESDMFHANVERCAVPLGGPGGLVAVLELNQTGRLPDTGVPVLQNGSLVMDFAWDPFDNYKLVVACDDARIRIWNIPRGGLMETLTQCTSLLAGHMEKIYFVKFHPLAKDVLLSASYDMTVKLWDMTTQQEMIELEGHTDTIFGAAWSPDGCNIATVCKDGYIRVYEPRILTTPIRAGPGPAGNRGARIIYVCDGAYIVVTGFSQMSHRSISIYDANDLSEPLTTVEEEVSPSILVPFYDEDGSTLMVTGRGDCSVLAYEVSRDFPHLFPLSTIHAHGPHQGLSFLTKSTVNVRDVEFAKAYRLTAHTIEPISFTVPRVKTDYFQDDLYPDTKVTWEPALTSQEWFIGMNKEQRRINMRPHDMKLLSQAPVQAPTPKKYESYNPETYKTDDQKKEELIGAMMGKLEHSDEPLPQDLTEGVEEEEWDDY